ncbi:MAG: IS66 family transposase, partial [Desulfovibrio sp.]|nr:IS66 family transposase [Desulfovibrio sp.]
MENNKFSFMDYKDFSEEELKRLPLDDLARLTYYVLQEYFKLKQQMHQNSTNSSRAPSSDSPEIKAQRKAEQKVPHAQHGERKQGAQLGHKATYRPLVPLEEGDIIIDCKPEICEHCGESLEGCVDPDPYRQQTYDFEIIRRTTEYRKHELTCPHCGKTTEGKLPAEANENTYSPNIAALVGVLTGLYQISRRMTAMFINEVLGIPISVGSVSNLEKELTETAIPVMEEIETVAQNAEQGNADETGYSLKSGKQGWLWVLVTPFAVLFRLFEGRGQEYASRLLGKFDGILTSDRWCGYNQYPLEKRQLCWAHILRDFKAMIESGADGEAIGTALRKEANAMFRLW